MRVTEGFSMADSRNLPQVNYLMLLEYMKENETMNAAEIRGMKVLVSSRASYIDTAVGYVELKRHNSICTIRCKVTPEHRVRTKLYTVTAVIDEAEAKLTVNCQDCAASEGGGCKHCICFIMWLIKRTDEPSVTSVKCYWSRPSLSAAVTDDKFIYAHEIGKTYPNTHISVPSREHFLEECRKRKISESLLTNYNFPKTTLDKFSILNLIMDYYSVTDNTKTAKGFLEYASKILTIEVKDAIEKNTITQANSRLWHSMRQGRITASKIHEVSRCKTEDGSLVQTILGGYKVPETEAIKRGKCLEKEVIKILKKDLNLNIEPCGFKLISPHIGASPDGLCNDFCVEIKCPTTNKAFETYIKNNEVTPKFKAQVQLQMHASGRKKALFCLADPQFESNKIYYMYWLYYDKMFVDKLISEADKFWCDNIYLKFINSISVTD